VQPEGYSSSPPGSGFDAVVVDRQDEASALLFIAHFRQTPGSGPTVVIVPVNGQARANEVFGRRLGCGMGVRLRSRMTESVPVQFIVCRESELQGKV
jgi:hypothetical protein